MKKKQLDVLREALDIMRAVSRSPYISDSDRSVLAMNCDKFSTFISELREFKTVIIRKEVEKLIERVEA
jgi:hypothetical protein